MSFFSLYMSKNVWNFQFSWCSPFMYTCICKLFYNFLSDPQMKILNLLYVFCINIILRKKIMYTEKLRWEKSSHNTDKNTSSGIRTRNLRIRSPTRYPLRHGGNKFDRPWWDSNPQPLDPKSSALSIAPQGLGCYLPKVEWYIGYSHVPNSPK